MMTTIKVRSEVRDRLSDLAHREGLSMGEMLTRLMIEEEERRMWRGIEADYSRLRSDPIAWARYTKERDVWLDADLLAARPDIAMDDGDDADQEYPEYQHLAENEA